MARLSLRSTSFDLPMIYCSMGNLKPYYRKDNYWFKKRERQLLKLMDAWIKLCVRRGNEDNAGWTRPDKLVTAFLAGDKPLITMIKPGGIARLWDPAIRTAGEKYGSRMIWDRLHVGVDVWAIRWRLLWRGQMGRLDTNQVRLEQSCRIIFIIFPIKVFPFYSYQSTHLLIIIPVTYRVARLYVCEMNWNTPFFALGTYIIFIYSWSAFITR